MKKWWKVTGESPFEMNGKPNILIPDNYKWHTQIIQHIRNIQTKEAYNNNDNNITTTPVRTKENNTQNTEAAGGKQRKKI
jgi:hypothetical protein